METYERTEERTDCSGRHTIITTTGYSDGRTVVRTVVRQNGRVVSDQTQSSGGRGGGGGGGRGGCDPRTGCQLQVGQDDEEEEEEQATNDGGGVTEINSLSQLKALQGSAGRRLLVVDFYANWCGPCRQMAPIYEQLAGHYSNVVFAKVNVDVGKEVSSAFRITSMPSFVLMKGGQEVDRVRGANPDGLQDAIERHR